jgi:4-hydroxyphenylpyruvate dioxygenase-like putative hemolysin
MSNPQPLAKLGLGSIEQVAYIVEDMEHAIPRYEALFGPFRVSEQKLPDCTVRGSRVDLEMKMAVNNSSPVEIELIQPVKGSSPWSEHLENHGEGLHHVRFRVAGIDAKLAELGERGFETLLYKRFGPDIAFAYLETPPEFGGHIIELLEMP